MTHESGEALMHELERMVREECARRPNSCTSAVTDFLVSDIRPEMYELYNSEPTIDWQERVRCSVAAAVLFQGLGAAVSAYCKATGQWR